MKSNNRFIYSVLTLLLVCITTSGCDQKVDYNNGYDTTATTEVGKLLVRETGLIGHIIGEKAYTVTPGVEAAEMAYVSYTGMPMRIFIFEVDLTDPNISIAASLPNNGTTFGMQPMTRQAEAADAPGNVVWAGVNGDFYNMDNGTPRGPVHRNGVQIKGNFDNGERSVFYVTKTKTAGVAHRDDYPAVNTSGVIQEAVGGGVMLVTGGNLVKQTDVTIEPRTCIGVDESGTKVFILVADGRNYTYSNGMLYEELAIMLRALGVHDGINLDGGGSSTFFVRTVPEFTEGRFEIRNRPTDNGGKERAVADGLLIISNQ